MPLENSERTVYYEIRKVGDNQVPILLPYSKLTIDGVDYIEMNSCTAILDGGGSHAVPAYGKIVGAEYRDRSAGVTSPVVGSGTTPPAVGGNIVHSFGWV